MSIETISPAEVKENMITISEIVTQFNIESVEVQKKISKSKVLPVAMLKKGSAGRPSRLFDRSQIEELFGL